MSEPFPVVPAATVPFVTDLQMREVDRVMVEELGITMPQMMENAGRSLADVVIALTAPRSAVVLAGSGGNGGGGLVAARHLANRGVAVRVVTSAPRLRPVPAHQFDTLRKLGVPMKIDPEPADVVVDALIGYSLAGEPRGRAAELIAWANGQDAPVISLDVPSGFDSHTGLPAGLVVRPAATVTLALPKLGLAAYAGRLFLADISVPPMVYRGLRIGSWAFTQGPIVEIRDL